MGLALWRIDHRAQEAVAALVAALRSPVIHPASKLAPPGPRGQQAAEALAQMGPAAQAAVPAVRDALADAQLSAYRPYYALALLKMDSQAAKVAMPALIQALDHQGATAHLTERAASILRKQAAQALGEIGAAAHDAVPSLRKALTDSDESVRGEASRALQRIGG
jgi:hypothetical protein